jgi:hypothetical protein
MLPITDCIRHAHRSGAAPAHPAGLWRLGARAGVHPDRTAAGLERSPAFARHRFAQPRRRSRPGRWQGGTPPGRARDGINRHECLLVTQATSTLVTLVLPTVPLRRATEPVEYVVGREPWVGFLTPASPGVEAAPSGTGGLGSRDYPTWRPTPSESGATWWRRWWPGWASAATTWVSYLWGVRRRLRPARLRRWPTPPTRAAVSAAP